MNAMTELSQVSTAYDAQKVLPAYDARQLTKNGQLANIVLEGQVYLLRITRAGKLILTK